MEPKPQDVREWKRMRAWDLHRHGWRHCVIAEALNVADESVSRWVSRAKRDGASSLLAHAHPGCPPRLTEEQRRLIPDFLWHGAEAYGFHGELWTCGRVAAVLKDEFGVSFHPGHVSRILKELGWTPQVPITKAIQRNEDEIDRWRREVWPELVLRPDASEEPLFSWMNQASICILRWSEPTPRRGRLPNCTSGRRGITSP